MKDFTVEQIVNYIISEQKSKPRVNIIEDILKELNLNYYLQNDKFATNIVVPFGITDDDYDTITLGAHYDIVPGSLGINDNTVAVAMLIKLATKIVNTKKRIDIVFFDREEDGMHGSMLYIEDKHLTGRIKSAIIFDIIGFGDTVLTSFTNDKVCGDYKKTIEKHVATTTITNVLVSDNVMFGAHSIPNILVVAAHNKDLTYGLIKESCLLGRHAEVYKSFHNRELDNKPEVINYRLVDGLLQATIEAYI